MQHRLDGFLWFVDLHSKDFNHYTDEQLAFLSAECGFRRSRPGVPI
jgi:hypothetical protein